MTEENVPKEDNMIKYYNEMKEGEYVTSINHWKIALLNTVKWYAELFLTILAAFCILMSQFIMMYEYHLKDLSNSRASLVYLSPALGSINMAVLNLLLNIVNRKIEEEKGNLPILQRKLGQDLWLILRDNLVQTTLIMICPNPFFRLLPRIPAIPQDKEAVSDVHVFMFNANHYAHILQLNKFYFIFCFFITNSKFYSESSYRLW